MNSCMKLILNLLLRRRRLLCSLILPLLLLLHIKSLPQQTITTGAWSSTLLGNCGPEIIHQSVEV